MILAYFLPVTLAIVIGLVSNFASLCFPAPYQERCLVKEAYWRQPGPLDGNLTVNRVMEEADTLFENQVVAPETIRFDQNGTMFLFTEKGIFTAAPTDEGFEDPVMFLDTQGGRPLSGAFDSNGDLYFCDTILGLGMIHMETRKYEHLFENDQIYFCDDVVISSRDEVYIADAHIFTPVTPEQTLQACFASILHGGKNGRLLKYTPSTKRLEILSEDVTFASGIELSFDESYLLASDGTMLRIRKHWLEGPKKDTVELFVENLPSYTDGISKGSNSTYWIALFEQISFSQSIVLSYRLLRWIAYKIPYHIAEVMLHEHGIIVQVDEQGTILRSFHDASGKFGKTTSIVEYNNKLYIGSFNNAVKVINL